MNNLSPSNLVGEHIAPSLTDTLQVPGVTIADIDALRLHIDGELPNLICYPGDITNKLAIKLRHPTMVPSSQPQDGFSFEQQQFGWDSYFHSRLLMLKGPEYYPVVLGMHENANDMIQEFGINPNSSFYNRLGHAQPPFQTSYAFEIYDTYKDTRPEINDEWLSSKIEIAKYEYASVWMGTKDPHNRLVFRGLSRYYDADLTDDHVQAESGWDYTPRFGGRAYDYLPADLNALLFKYEMDFAREAGIRGDEQEMNHWLAQAETRRNTMNELMYDKEKGVYHDYNFRTGKWGPVDSLASYVAMWAGMVEPRSEQAEQMVRALRIFECIGGLAVTEECEVSDWEMERRPPQWRHPNSFSSVTMLTVDGLEICGYPEEARRIALKSLAAKALWHRAHGVILEAYNAEKPLEMPVRGVYPRQIGFGWSDAEIEYFATKYIDNRSLPAHTRRGAVLLHAAEQAT